MKASDSPIRYAVVGLGNIAQVAVLPAFAHAKKNSQLTALVSDDAAKLRQLGKKYKISTLGGYGGYPDLLKSGLIDAVYIALPNSLHRDYAMQAAAAGIHVLCEKPLAVTEEDCQQMINAAAIKGVYLMTAYRLHFDVANLGAIKILQSGKIGKIRIFNSLFTQQIKKGDIRLQKNLGGGSLYDLGIYCVNAARYLFRDEPEEVSAFTVRNTDSRFHEVDEMTMATMRFSDGRLACFTSSFGASANSQYSVVGTKGTLRMENAYDLAAARTQIVETANATQRHHYPAHDQFAPELIYFSDCILRRRTPEPSGQEGLIDVKIIQALYRSAETGHPILLNPGRKTQRPSHHQKISRPKVKKPALIHAPSPKRKK